MFIMRVLLIDFDFLRGLSLMNPPIVAYLVQSESWMNVCLKVMKELKEKEMVFLWIYNVYL